MGVLALAPLAMMMAAAPPREAAPEPSLPEQAAPAREDTSAAIEAMAASADRDAQAPRNLDDPLPPQASEDPAADNPDPFEPINRVFYAISQPIDALLLRPVAIVYKTVLPEPVRDGVHNALSNLFTPTVLANDILQLRPRRAGKTLARFVINSTFGVGGLFDVARRKPFNIEGHPNSLSDTLGVAGAGPGVYLYLPVMGPTSVRDLIGMVGDAFTQPLLLDRVTHTQVTVVNKRKRSFVTSTFSVSTQGLAVLLAGGVDARARADGELQALKRQSVDPYAALRSNYLQNRAGQVAMLKAKDGAPVEVPAFDDTLADPEATPKPTVSPAANPAH